MRTRLAIALLSLAALATPALAAKPKEEIPRAEVQTWPEEHQEAYALMVKRCGECHTVLHALAARMPVAVWSVRLRKMAKLGAGLSGVEMAEVAQFRAFWMEHRTPSP